MKLCLTYHGVIYSKKNSKRIIINRRTRRPMIVSSQQAKIMESDMVSQFQAQLLQTPILLPIATILGKPLKINIMIWQKDQTRRDLDNQATSILDALVAAGVIADDSIKVVQELTVKMVTIDKHNPHAIIEIEGVKQ